MVRPFWTIVCILWECVNWCLVSYILLYRDSTCNTVTLVPGSYYRYVAYIGAVHVTQLPWSLEAIIDTLLAMVFRDRYEDNCVCTTIWP